MGVAVAGVVVSVGVKVAVSVGVAVAGVVVGVGVKVAVPVGVAVAGVVVGKGVAPEPGRLLISSNWSAIKPSMSLK